MSAPEVSEGDTLEMSYESNAAGAVTKTVEVLNVRSFTGSSGYTHTTVRLRDTERNERDKMELRVLLDDGEVVLSTVYGYAHDAYKAKDYGRRLGRHIEFSES